MGAHKAENWPLGQWVGALEPLFSAVHTGKYTNFSYSGGFGEITRMSCSYGRRAGFAY
jgi:hypothetical protein